MNKNKLVALGLTACMAMGVLAGCGGDSKENVDSSKSSIQSQQEIEDDAKVSDVNTEPEYEVSDENQLLADIINYASSDAGVTIKAEEQDGFTETFDTLGLSIEDVSEYAIYLDRDTKEVIALVKPADGKADIVKQAFNDYITINLDSTSADVMELAEGAVLQDVGDGYVVLVMQGDSASIVSRVDEALLDNSVMSKGLNVTLDDDRTLEEQNAEVTDEDLNNEIIGADVDPSMTTGDSTTNTGSNVVTNSGTSGGSYGVGANGALNTSDTWQ